MALEPTDSAIIFEVDEGLGIGIAGTDTFKVEYSEDGGSSYYTAGKSQNTADYTGIQVNDATYGLAFEQARTCYVADGTNRLKITITSGECSGESHTEIVTL